MKQQVPKVGGGVSGRPSSVACGCRCLPSGTLPGGRSGGGNAARTRLSHFRVSIADLSWHNRPFVGSWPWSAPRHDLTNRMGR